MPSTFQFLHQCQISDVRAVYSCNRAFAEYLLSKNEGHGHNVNLTHFIFTAFAHHCLSNAVHGQTINLPVCVCVYVPHNDQLGRTDFRHNALSPQCIVGMYRCVSVTLSVNWPSGQTPQRIFTVDSLKDADLRKDVRFWVSR